MKGATADPSVNTKRAPNNARKKIIGANHHVWTNGVFLWGQYSQSVANTGGSAGSRTPDHLIKSQMLYQLSYRPTAS